MLSAVKKFKPPPKISTTDWSRKYRFLSAKSSAKPGKYNPDLTPYIAGIHEALDDRLSHKVVCMKSAQVAWTDGALNNYIAKRIDIDPCPMILMFSKEGSAQEYVKEKLTPMIEVTPRLREKIDISKSRSADNTQLFKNFDGGFLKMGGSNSPSISKSSPVPVVMVEEPDDCSTNVKGGQGNSLKMLEERTKTFDRRKVIFGGTPTVKGFSIIEHAYKNSDQRKFFVPCNDCGEKHVLHWDNVKWLDGADISHEVYGKSQPETAIYACPNCGTTWNDQQRIRNVKKGRWIAQAEFRGVAGFYINELYSPFPGSKLPRLVEKYLEAVHKQEAGDNSDMVVFQNNTLGLAYEFKSDAPEQDQLEERALDYSELTVPMGGLILTVGVDVQLDRLAIIIRAWGRGQESWLVYWGEIAARHSCKDENDPVWRELDKLLFREFKHELGAALKVSAVSIDSSDGGTNDAVYHWVRKKKVKEIMAIKGESSKVGSKEIQSLPKPIDQNKPNTKNAKYGLQVHIVGTVKAKDLIDGRLKLQGNGPGRMHWYKEVRADYYEQMLSEVKIPDKNDPKKKVWTPKAGVRNEALDCEVYALHAARTIKIHIKSEAYWTGLENSIRQRGLFAESNDQPQPAPKKRGRGRRVRGG